MTRKLILLFTFFSGIAVAQQVNPRTQILWPRITGAGTPAATSTVCSAENYGQPYQNTAVNPNTNYVCANQGGTPTWQLLNGGGGITALTSDVTASGSGSVVAIVNGIRGVPFCSGFSPTNGQQLQYTTGGSPNPCYSAATGSGSLSGQTTACAPKAASATTSTSSLPVCDDGTTTTISHPLQVTGSGPPISIPSNKATSPAAGTGQFGTDASGNVVRSNNGGAQSIVAGYDTFAAPPAVGNTTPAPSVTSEFGTFKGPRVDITSPDFGSGCSNAADPTGTNDSTCAIGHAITYAQGLAGAGTVPLLYFPRGTFKTNDVLRVSCDVAIEGDGIAATQLSLTNNTASGLTIAGQIIGGWTCQGGMRGITLIAANNHNYVGNQLELLNTTAYTLDDIEIENGGGVGIDVVGDTERIKAHNIWINSVRWPLISGGNEDDWSGVQINSPGQAGDNYCYSSNCPNGVAPNTSFGIAQTLVSVTGSGSTLTVVVSGGTNTSGGGNGISPLAAGHIFNLTGTSTGSITANGFWTVATAANNTPTSGEYTLTATNGINSSTGAVTTFSGTGSATGGTFTLSLLPTHNPAIYLSGARPSIKEGSIKTIVNSIGIQSSAGPAQASDLYIENSGTAASSPLINAAVEAPGWFPMTTLTAPLPGTSSPATASVVTNQWFPTRVTLASDETAVSGGDAMIIAPCDYTPGSAVASTCAGIPGGTTKGTYELVTAVSVGTTSVYLAQRGGSVAWPSGSIIGMHPVGSGGASPIQLTNILGGDVAAGGSSWTPLCIDGTVYVCSVIIAGNIENGLTSLSHGQNATLSSYAYASEVGNITVSTGSWGDTAGGENIGSGAVKMQGIGGFINYTGIAPPGSINGVVNSASLPGPNGNILGQPGIWTPPSQDASVPALGFHDTTSGTTVNTYSSNLFYKPVMSSGSDPTGPDSMAGIQFKDAYAFWDIGTTHSQNRWRFAGSPATTGGSAGFLGETWSGSAWTQQWRLGSDGSVNATAFAETPYFLGTNGQAVLGGDNGSHSIGSNESGFWSWAYNYSGSQQGQVYMQGENSPGGWLCDTNDGGHGGGCGYGFSLGFNLPAGIHVNTSYPVGFDCPYANPVVHANCGERSDGLGGWTMTAQTVTGLTGYMYANGTSPVTSSTTIPAANIAAGALANGMTATTQSPGDNSTKVATTAYVDAASGTVSANTIPRMNSGGTALENSDCTNSGSVNCGVQIGAVGAGGNDAFVGTITNNNYGGVNLDQSGAGGHSTSWWARGTVVGSLAGENEMIDHSAGQYAMFAWDALTLNSFGGHLRMNKTLWDCFSSGDPGGSQCDRGFSSDASVAGQIDVDTSALNDKLGGIAAANGVFGTSLKVAGNDVCQSTGTNCPAASAHGQYYWSFPSYGSDGTGLPVSAVYYLPNGLSSVAAAATGRFDGTCTSYPVMTILDLGTSASSTSGTTLLTLTFTTSGVVTTSGTVTVASGHYLGISTTDSIACSVQNDLDVTMTY